MEHFRVRTRVLKLMIDTVLNESLGGGGGSVAPSGWRWRRSGSRGWCRRGLVLTAWRIRVLTIDVWLWMRTGRWRWWRQTWQDGYVSTCSEDGSMEDGDDGVCSVRMRCSMWVRYRCVPRSVNTAWLGPSALDVRFWCEVWVFDSDNPYPFIKWIRVAIYVTKMSILRLVNILLCKVFVNN